MIRRTVGEAIKHFGFEAEVKAAINRVAPPDRADAIYNELCGWYFKVNTRATGRFGVCKYKTRTIEIAAALLKMPHDFRETFFHELSHALDKLINGRPSKHGHPWRSIMVNGFGLPPNRCGDHSEEAVAAMIELKAKKAKYIWECSKCGHEFPMMRRRKRPPEAYTHKTCGGRLRAK